MKIAGSDYFLGKSGKRHIERDLARKAFFYSVETHAPEVLKTLKEMILPHYHKVVTEQDIILTATFNPDDICWKHLKGVSKKDHPYLFDLKSIINQWSDKYNVSEEWIKDMALKTLAYWEKSPPMYGKLSWYDEVLTFSVTNPIPKEHRISSFDFNFQIKGYNPFLESWKSAEKRIVSKVKYTLKTEYKKEREALAEKIANELGFVRVKNKRQLEKHIRWLIEYQIHKKSSGKISQDELSKSKYDENQIYWDEENNVKPFAEREKKRNNENKPSKYSRHTVMKAINNTAELLGITLRTKIQSK